MELDPAAVIFQHAADDREAETGALLTRRDVGFEQSRAAHLRQADAVVDDVDQDVIALARGDDLDTPLPQLLRRNRVDRLGGVLDDVGQRLRNQPPVEARPQRILG